MSRSEIFAHVSRALEGLRCETGQYRDAASLVVWLEMRGLNGLSQLLESLGADHPGSPWEIPVLDDEAREIRLDLSGRCCFIDGPLILDVACANATFHEPARIDLLNCQHPYPLLAYAAISAHRGFHCAFHWTAAESITNQILAVMMAGDVEPTLYMWDSSLNLTALGSRAAVLCSRNAATVSKFVSDTIEGREPLTTQLSPQNFSSRNLNSEEYGVTVDTSDWEMLRSLGDRVLVEDTCESRNRGAGPGA